MRLCRIVIGVSLLLLPAFFAGQDTKLSWDWRNQEVIGRNDASVGNTSKLTEAERSSLMDALVLRLQKPMSDAGYDDDRIREIASTTRIRFVDLGDGKPLLLATSLGLEGGCDAMGNCPLWIFRRTSKGFLSVLTAIAASYTVQPPEGGVSDLILMHHITPRQSGLRLYHYADHKLVDAGCFEANWPKPSDDPTQVSDPSIQPCNEERLNQYGLPNVRQVHPHPDEKLAHPVAPIPVQAPQPAQDAPSTDPTKEQAPAEQPAQQVPATDQPKESPPASQEASPADKPNEQAAPIQDAPKSEQAPPSQDAPKEEQTPPPTDQKAPDTSQETPKQDQAPPPANETAPPAEAAPKPEQAQPAPEQPTPDAGQNASAPKSDQPPPPTSPEPPPPANPEPPKSEQTQPAPDQQPANPDNAPPPSEDKKPDPPPSQNSADQPAPPQEAQPAPQSPNQQ